MTVLDKFVALSNGYTKKKIDFELCGYKKLNDTYDIEISGLDNKRFKTMKCTVFVWQINPGYATKEVVRGIRTLEDLLCVLQDIEERYKNVPSDYKK